MGGNAPQRPGVFGRRNVNEVLERRREREADLRGALYVGAWGREFATVRDQQNDTTYVVANPTGKTYKPGSVVFLGSNTGHPPEVLLSGPPAGFGGASTAFTVPYRTPLPAEPTVDPDGIAYFLGSIKAAYYIGADGDELVGEAAEVAESLDSPVFIRDDARDKVNGLSLAYAVIASDRISCFDPIAGEVYSYTVPDAYQVSGVHYASGYLWWCEGEKEQHGGSGTFATYFRLRRANCDLTDVTTIGSFEFDNDAGDGPGVSLDWSQGFSAHINLSTGLVVEALWGEGEVQGSIRITWAYAGTQTHDSSSAWEDPLPSSDVTVEEPVAVTDHPTYGTPLMGGAYPLTV